MSKKAEKRTNRIKAANQAVKLKAKVGLWALTLSYTLLSLIISLTAAWVLLAKQDFIYGVWHDHGGIGQGIDTYGPQNRYKPGFGDTSRAERIRIFAEINRSIHEGGEGLEAIIYQSSSSGGEQALLRTPEVVHLQDVAKLIDFLFVVTFVSTILWLAVSIYLLLVRHRMPSIRQQLSALPILLIPSILLVLAIGPKSVFNTLHIWVFPAGHQWFFYYQESLMSTMMLAPNLFGWIALALLALSIVIFLLIQYTLFFIGKRTG